MKKFIVILVVISLFVSCSDPKKLSIPVNGETRTVVIQPYGAFNMEDKNPNVKYRTVVGNVVWSIIGIETVVIPVVLIGWYLFEPVNTIDNYILGVE